MARLLSWETSGTVCVYVCVCVCFVQEGWIICLMRERRFWPSSTRGAVDPPPSRLLLPVLLACDRAGQSVFSRRPHSGSLSVNSLKRNSARRPGVTPVEAAALFLMHHWCNRCLSLLRCFYSRRSARFAAHRREAQQAALESP